MQDIERLAVFTMIGVMRSQLDGLESLVAGAANLAKKPAAPTRAAVHPDESPYASPEEEARIAQMLEKQRQQAIDELAGKAADKATQLWGEAAAETHQ